MIKLTTVLSALSSFNIAPYSMTRHKNIVFFDIDFVKRNKWLDEGEICLFEMLGIRNYIADISMDGSMFAPEEYNINTAIGGYGTFYFEIDDSDNELETYPSPDFLTHEQEGFEAQVAAMEVSINLEQ